jgi:hypothetical protein
LWKPLSNKWKYNSIQYEQHEQDFYFLWGSERSGFMQIYLYKYHFLTKEGICLSKDIPIGGGGEWVVER